MKDTLGDLLGCIVGFMVCISFVIYYALTYRINKARDLILAHLRSMDERLETIEEKLQEFLE